MKPAHGEVYELDLTGFPELGSWEARPGVVVSSDFFNRRLDTVVVVALTRNLKRKDQAGCILVPQSSAGKSPGLKADSVALCHSPLTVPKGVLGRRLGKLPADLLSDIEETLAFALNLGPSLGE